MTGQAEVVEVLLGLVSSWRIKLQGFVSRDPAAKVVVNNEELKRCGTLNFLGVEITFEH